MINESSVPDDSTYIYADSDDGSCVVELREGATLIASRTVAANLALQTYVFTLTSFEQTTIVDWTNLSIWFITNGTNIAKLKLATLYPPIPGDVRIYVRVQTVTV